MAETLSDLERRLLLALREVGRTRPEDIVGKFGFSHLVEVMNAASWLRSKGYLRVEEERVVWYELDEEGRRYVRSELPEVRIIRMLLEAGGMLPLRDINAEMPKALAAAGVGVLVKFGARVEGGALIVDDPGSMEREVMRNQDALERLERGERGVEPEIISRLARRGRILKRRERFERIFELTKEGAGVAAGTTLEDEVSQLTPELIQSGRYREVRFRRYDIHRFVPAVFSAKRHPMMQIAEEVRRTFLEMGFTEIDTGIIQPAFWNMDALFVPQDHPAREMQDSFFVDLPPADIDGFHLGRVRDAHRGTAYSTRGWGPDWSVETASRLMMRTHTTVATIRYLAERVRDRLDACRVFVIGRCYRRDPMDATHLSEFTQVDGILMEEGADLRMLIGLLHEFYRRMGMPEIRIKPGYFPFTEPSLEVLIRSGDTWLEGVGAGIFRPEVTEPWGIKHPVLAWGMGLERMALVRFDISDIRKIYHSDVQWLRERGLT